MPSDTQQPEYFCEHIHAILWQQPDSETLGLTIPPLTPPDDATIILSGDITLRYGILLLKTPKYQIVPGYFETENGAVRIGRAAWDIIWKKFQLYPRADVIGLRNDGKSLHVLMRDLDFGESGKVLAYADENSEESLGMIQEFNIPPDADLPQLLAGYAKNLR